MVKMWTAWLGWPGLGLARLARLAALPGLGAGTLRVLSRARIYGETEGFPSSGRNQWETFRKQRRRLGVEAVLAAKMVTVPHVPVASVLSASHLPTGAGAVPIVWKNRGSPFGRRTKFGEAH